MEKATTLTIAVTILAFVAMTCNYFRSPFKPKQPDFSDWIIKWSELDLGEDEQFMSIAENAFKKHSSLLPEDFRPAMSRIINQICGDLEKELSSNSSNQSWLCIYKQAGWGLINSRRDSTKAIKIGKENDNDESILCRLE